MERELTGVMGLTLLNASSSLSSLCLLGGNLVKLLALYSEKSLRVCCYSLVLQYDVGHGTRSLRQERE